MRVEPTCAVPVVPRPKQSAGLLILSFNLPFGFALIWEGVNALVTAGVAVRVVDDDVVRGDGQVNPQLVTGQTALGLGTQSAGQGLSANGERYNSPEINHHFTEIKHARILLGRLIRPPGTSFWRSSRQKTRLQHDPNIHMPLCRPGERC